MAGLFDTLALGSRSLQTYRKAIDTSGHNLANVNTPGYTRQRLAISSVTTEGEMGATGAGAEATRIVSLRNSFAQKQLQTESSLEGSLEVKDDTLRQALTALQETIDRTSENGTSTNGLSQKLNDFFSALQNLSTNPSDVSERQNVLQKARDLAAKFNQIDQRLDAVSDDLNVRISDDVNRANTLLGQITELNMKIAGEEVDSPGSANDLRDVRQTKIEELSKILKLDAVEQPNGTVNIIIDAQTIVDGININANVETFDAGNGNYGVRLAGQTAALNISGGSIEGAMSVRDGQLARVRADINTVATNFISEVNTLHTAGFSLTGSTGLAFFQGSGSADIAVSQELTNPMLLQASGKSDVTGDNATILALVELATKAQAALGGQSFSERHTQIVTGLAQDVATARTDLEDQQAVTQFVQNQRDSVSAVSLDEEMANLVMFQKAFEASARLISMTDEMLSTILEM